MLVDIVIPVLNEEETLNKNVRFIVNFLDESIGSQYDYRIVIADNGSTDGTQEIGLSLSTELEEKVAYFKVPAKGVGLALKSYWKESSADIVGYMDLDMATDLKHVHEALDCFKNSSIDIVYGSRLHRDSVVVGRTIKREITSRVFNWVLRMYLRTKFSDGMCGFKFLKRSVFEILLNKGAVSDGWFFCTEILVVGEWNRFNLHELPVKWTDDENSKVNIKKLTIEYLKAMKALKRFRVS